jgi:AcrR family transcriptional regulator
VVVDVVTDTRDRIRQEAVALFTERGYATTSLREIADRVGITKASLYYHYPSKQDLLAAVVEPLLADWKRTVGEAERLPRTDGNVRTVLGSCLDTMLSHRAVANLFLRDAAAMLAALAPMLDDLLEVGLRLRIWLAGPDPSPVARVRAVAAMELLGAGLSAGATLDDVPDPLVRQTLLESAELVLAGRAGAA